MPRHEDQTKTITKNDDQSHWRVVVPIANGYIYKVPPISKAQRTMQKRE